MFLNHRWVLFGAIRNDPNPDVYCLYHPYLEIIDPTSCTCSTTLELDESVFKRASKDSSIHIRCVVVRVTKKVSLQKNEGMRFVSDANRGIISVEIYHCTPETQEVQYFEASAFILDTEVCCPKFLLHRISNGTTSYGSTCLLPQRFFHTIPGILVNIEYCRGARAWLGSVTFRQLSRLTPRTQWVEGVSSFTTSILIEKHKTPSLVSSTRIPIQRQVIKTVRAR